jgi:hypothetical protein
MSHQQDDNPEFEIPRLDDRPSTSENEPLSEEKSSQPGSDPQADTIVFRPARGAPRVRRALTSAVAIGLTVALAIILILASFPSAHDWLNAPLRLFAPPSTPTIPLDSDIILLKHSVPWGELHLESSAVHAIYLGYRNGHPAYRLLRGRHTLFYVAVPFSVSSCTVTVPKSSVDDCKMSLVREVLGKF